MANRVDRTRRGVLAGLVGSAAIAAFPGRGLAADQFNWRAVALHRSGEGIKKWTWLQEELPARTGGRIQLDVVTAQEMGLTGTELSRLLRSGAIQMAEVNSTYIAGDFPLVEATELPGVVRSFADGQKIVRSWSKNVVAPAADKIGGQTIGDFAWSSGFLFTKFPVNSLEDLKGKKIRVFSPGLAAYVEALGATPISMPLSEVYSALQRGLMDGVLTGTDQINSMKMWEIAPYLTDVRLAPTSAYIIVSQRHWDALPEDLKEIVAGLGREMTQLGWELGADNDRIGFEAARANNMTITVPVPEDWSVTLDQVARETIIPWWVGRVGGDAGSLYNEYIGSITGIEI
ncbi:TRAP transporter substrate-binding protein DctP [Nitratireductor aquimarinus]|uniref:TRAP transporter substrate-binding protein DctP n=1 Tax=Nitratireductor aquimarinus TaxID=889300 RepID=A0ABU4AM33_9HYPH|nr:TRAP transporter substrate-binding protein DctP [Nitratireductor aquimarinus]MDV6227284.1 TRAP transporter substrate-binding protein DctP [Nitratireductor aquimarinus]